MNNSEFKKIRYSGTCSLCNGKVKLLDRNYTHILSDGTLCQKCDMALLKFLSERNSWGGKDEFLSVMEKNYSYRNYNYVLLEDCDYKLLQDLGCCYETKEDVMEEIEEYRDKPWNDIIEIERVN